MEPGKAILTDMFEEPSKLMHQTALHDIFTDDQKQPYVYDFLNMWTFFVTCVEEAESIAGVSYPQLVFSHGVVPDEALQKHLSSQRKQPDDDQEGWEDESYQDDQWY